MSWLAPVVQELVKSDETVLDLGCGLCAPTKTLKCKGMLHCDGFEKYLDQVKKDVMVCQVDLRSLLPFPNDSYDVVLLLDVIEHLYKEEARFALLEAERVARKRVIVYTPNGFVKQEHDAWNLGGAVWQQHRCGFTLKELEDLGYAAKMIPPDNNILAVKVIVQ